MRCIDLPKTTNDLFVSFAAWAIVSSLATFEAKEVTKTLFFIPFITSVKLFLTSDSDPDLPFVKTFVESQTIARISLVFDLSSLKSIAFPTTGSSSIFQSPV